MKCTKLEPRDLVLIRQKAFKGKHKVSNRWENTPYHVIECIGEHLPVQRVQLVGETTRFRNLLFPLAMRNESDKKQQNMEEKEPKLTDPEEENYASSVEHVESYEGPIARSKTKRMGNELLLKAIILMSNHFND